MATTDPNPSFVGESMMFRDSNPSLVRESMTVRDPNQFRNPNPSMVPEWMKFEDSNPSPLASVVEKTVYIRSCKHDFYGGKMDWYEIKLSNETRESKRKRSGGEGNPPPFTRESKRKRSRGEGCPPPFTAVIEPIWKKVETPMWSCCVVLGSTIYSIGGCNNIYDYYSKEVRAADMSSRQFRYVAPMNAARWYPHAVTADDKIYVFGGLNGKGPEIEVFDPINNMWEIITPPSHPIPSFNCRGGFVTYDEASKRIICASIHTKCLLAYDTKRGSWQSLDSAFDFRLKKNETGVAVFENTLYWICKVREPRAELVVYDMDLGVSASTIIVGLEGFILDGRYDRPPLVHLCGNEFYVIWRDAIYIDNGNGKGEEPQSLVRCARILVSKQVDRQNRKIRVKAEVFPTKTHLLPRLYNIMNAVVLSRQSTSSSTQQHQEPPITSQFEPGLSSYPPQNSVSQLDSPSQHASSDSSFSSELTQLQSDFTSFSARMGQRADDLERGVTDVRRDITQFRTEVQLTLTSFSEEVTNMLQQLIEMIQPPPGGIS